MHLNYPELVHKDHDAYLAYPVKMYLEGFGTVEGVAIAYALVRGSLSALNVRVFSNNIIADTHEC